MTGGANIGRSFKSALLGGIAGAAFGAMHAWNPMGSEMALKAIAHGVAGGFSSVMQGGQFGDGFISAFSTQAFTLAGGFEALGATGSQRLGQKLYNAMLSAVVGGTVSSLSGGKFENGAVSGAFSRMLNDTIQGTVKEKNYSITEKQRKLAAAGDREGFWKSRLIDSGDPMGDIGLKAVNNEGGLLDYLIGGQAINNRLQAYAKVYGQGPLNLDEVGITLMNAHIRFTDLDTSGVRGLLNPGQIAEYHHQVFGQYGLPPTTFGGTPMTGAVGEAWLTRPVWCGGCDWR